MEHHHGISVGARKVIRGGAQQHGFAQIYRESVHPVAQAVQQVQLGAGAEEELDFSVVIIVYVLHLSAEALLEGNAPYALAVFVVKADGQMVVLIQVVGLARLVVLYREQAGGHHHGGIPLQHLHLGALEGAFVQTDAVGGVPPR